MPVNKVVLNTANGKQVLIDLTMLTVTPETLAEGVIAMNAAGELIVGTHKCSDTPGPSYTNLAGNVQYDKRLSSSGKISSTAMTGAAVTDFIPIKQGDVLRIKGLNIMDDLASSAYPYFCFYTGASESNVTATSPVYLVPSQHGSSVFPGYKDTPNGGVCSWTAFTVDSLGTQHNAASSLTHVRISGKYLSDKNIIVTVNEEIT